MAETKGIKEAFAEFFEDPDRAKFRELIQNNTGEYNHIDFKEFWIKDEKLAKNILGVFTPRLEIIYSRNHMI